jgi:hypothetical protein
MRDDRMTRRDPTPTTVTTPITIARTHTCVALWRRGSKRNAAQGPFHTVMPLTNFSGIVALA